jgi:hypothetical protein
MLAWSFTTLPVAAKYRMSSVGDFVLLETSFTILQFAVVAPLIALAYRDAREHIALLLGAPQRNYVPHDPQLAERMARR